MGLSLKAPQITRHIASDIDAAQGLLAANLHPCGTVSAGTEAMHLGTQVANADVTGQQINFPGVAEHIDAIAGAPYFSHDRSVPYSDALLEKNVTDTIAGSKSMCDTARAKSPKIRCILYEGGQHELTTDLLPMDQYTAVERSQFIGDIYYKYLKTIENSDNDLVVLFQDVNAITKYGAWANRNTAVKSAHPSRWLLVGI